MTVADSPNQGITRELISAIIPAIYYPSWGPWLRIIGTAYTVVILIIILRTVPAWLGLPL